MNTLLILLTILNMGLQTREEQSQALPHGCSGTLPVVVIQTVNGVSITSNEDYVYATGMLISTTQDTTRLDTLQIRGRGNWTWRGFDKKPYRIKLASKIALAGMTKSKHWALMAGADDNMGFLKNPTGYYLSQAIGLQWTPAYRPVELMLNGQYQGLYFLTETVRVDSKRTNITEQSDLCTDADSITGGWLVEIDNYEEEGQVVVTGDRGETIRITPKTPEILSQQQYLYLSTQMHALNSAIYASDTSISLSSILDLREAAKFYLVNEIMLDCESFHGSCYLHKDNDLKGDTKWYFGPVWDFGNALNRTIYGGDDAFIWDRPEFEQYWLEPLCTHTDFQDILMEEWYVFYHTIYPTLMSRIDSLAAAFQTAAKYDAQCWNWSANVNTYSRPNIARDQFKQHLQRHIQWLYAQWGEGNEPSGMSESRQPARPHRLTLRNGRVTVLWNGQQYTADGVRLH